MAKRFLPVLLLIIIALNSCTLEQRLAYSFVKTEKPLQFYLLQPSYIFKYNLKEFEVPGIDTLSDFTRDSILLENSLFLQFLNDTAVIYNMVSGLVAEFKKAGVTVIPEHAVDTLMENGGTPFILNMAQFSMEEYIHPFSSEEQVYDETIIIDGIDVNAINYNLWIELGQMNTEKPNRVLFISDNLTDDISGTVKQNLLSGKMSFDYTIDTITEHRVYEFAYRFGQYAAQSLFDYLMNEYILENLQQDFPYERYYYHFDSERNLIYPIGEEERIIELD